MRQAAKICSVLFGVMVVAGPGLAARLPGDVNRDGSVDGVDAYLVEEYLGGPEPLACAEKLAADVTQDGLIDASDLSLLRLDPEALPAELDYSFFSSVVATEAGQRDARFMSFNTHFGCAANPCGSGSGDFLNIWPNRKRLVFDAIEEHRPDVIGSAGTRQMISLQNSACVRTPSTHGSPPIWARILIPRGPVTGSTRSRCSTAPTGFCWWIAV